MHEEPVDAGRDITWMPEGDMGGSPTRTSTMTAPLHSPTPFICSAVFSVAQGVHFRMLPSSRGNTLVRFDSMAERDYVADMSPIIFDGARLTLERSEDSSNRSPALARGHLRHQLP